MEIEVRSLLDGRCVDEVAVDPEAHDPPPFPNSWSYKPLRKSLLGRPAAGAAVLFKDLGLHTAIEAKDLFGSSVRRVRRFRFYLCCRPPGLEKVSSPSVRPPSPLFHDPSDRRRRGPTLPQHPVSSQSWRNGVLPRTALPKRIETLTDPGPKGKDFGPLSPVDESLG